MVSKSAISRCGCPVSSPSHPPPPPTSAHPFALSLADAEKARIEAWLTASGLNQYGDAADTMYMGGTPLFDERTGEVTDRFVYLLRKFPNRPWNAQQ
jgi:hypothetical protein